MKEDESFVYVESVTDYLNALPEGDEFFDTLLDKMVLYRGQGNKNWSLMPGVMRDREDYLNEELYIKECLRQYPEEFENMSKVDVLIKMQHYGIPTRLLDLTSNPLVALYFACASQPDEDGVVYVTQGPVTRSSDLYVNVVVESLFSYKSHGKVSCPASGMKVGERSLSKDDIERIIGYETPIVFQASLSNPRIRNQNGYFSIYRGISDWKAIPYFLKIHIKKEFKEKIIVQLSRFGIDSKFIFPEFSNAAPCIVSSIKKRNLKLNKNFSTPLDKGTISP